MHYLPLKVMLLNFPRVCNQINGLFAGCQPWHKRRALPRLVVPLAQGLQLPHRLGACHVSAASLRLPCTRVRTRGSAVDVYCYHLTGIFTWTALSKCAPTPRRACGCAIAPSRSCASASRPIVRRSTHVHMRACVADSRAFAELVLQLGESSQVLTGGLLRATPHAVEVRLLV